MKKYRCPYCKKEIDSPHGKCPGCGRILRPPEYAPGAADRRARRKKIDAIRRNAEREKAGMSSAPSLRRNPAFYLVVIMGLALLGLSLVNVMRGGGDGAPSGDRKMLRAMQGADTIAEALGRFKFHAGEYPDDTIHEGIGALVMKEVPRHPDALGPYLRAQGWIPGENGAPARPAPIRDPWGNPYVYELSGDGETASVVSFGPDGERGTSDDIAAHREAFEKPFTNPSWTNDWVHYTKRGIIVKETPPEERIREDRGEALLPWLLGAAGVLGGLLLVLSAALFVQSRKGRANTPPAPEAPAPHKPDDGPDRSRPSGDGAAQPPF